MDLFYVLVAFGAVIFLKDPRVSENFLLASGTAVCGGTAIASVAPTIRAQPEDLTTAITIVFLLNAIAVLFSLSNSLLDLGDRQFGAWAA